MNFFFPSDPATADAAPRLPENPMGNLLGSVLGDALVLEADVIRTNAQENGFDVSAEIEPALCARQIENREAVLRIAAQQEAPAASPKDRPDGGWIHAFLRFSGDAASEMERAVWGRLLALELAEPRTVSRRTLQYLHAMDLWEVEAFTEYCAFAFSFESGWRFMFEGESARREIWSYGREIDLTQHWIDVGLLSDEPSTLALRNAKGLRVLYRSKSWEVRSDEACSPEGAFPIRYRKFSTIGQQISSALSFKTFNGYARNLIQALGAEGQAVFSLIPDSE